jgi:Ion channel
MIVAMIASVVLVLVTILIHYEVLRVTSEHLAELPIPPRFNVLVVMLAVFTAHTIEVWLYGAAYWVLSGHYGLGGFGGTDVTGGFEDSLYFSAVTYTSLGFGDLFPVGHFRLLSGVEALNGLVLIGWSASFTYLTMAEFWPMHQGAARRLRGDRERG